MEQAFGHRLLADLPRALVVRRHGFTPPAIIIITEALASDSLAGRNARNCE
jgi:hypothetical protein